MWTRKELKTRAKAVLKKIYWKAFLISIVIALAGGNNGGSSGGGDSSSSGSRNSPQSLSSAIPNTPNDDAWNLTLLIIIVSLLILVCFALRIFIGYLLEVGGRRYFIQSAQYSDNSKCFRFAFESQNYTGIMSTMLLRGVQNFLWYLLLIIPGIIKSYAYRMVPYILADNPNIGRKKAIALSTKMTEGHKFDMFILELSFIGWYILGMLALVVGMLFVLPYENATNAELYLVLRKNALDSNLCSYDDLRLDYPRAEKNFAIE